MAIPGMLTPSKQLMRANVNLIDWPNWGFFHSGQIFYSSKWGEFSYMLPDTSSFKKAVLTKQLASLKAASCDTM